MIQSRQSRARAQDTVAHPGTQDEWVDVAHLYKLLGDCETPEWGGAADKNDEIISLHTLLLTIHL